MSGKENPGSWIGTSGYQYKHWQGVFYPDDLPKKEWLKYYSGNFNAVEINNTFYSLPKVECFKNWRNTVGEDFKFVLKFSRYGSHIKRLKDSQSTISQFMECAQYLGEKLAAVLVQIPPKWKPAPERLKEFLSNTPDNTSWAFEVRDSRWLNDEIFDILRNNNVALCIHDIIPDHPEVITADWVYLRFHGTDYTEPYSYEQLCHSSEKIKKYLSQGLDVMTFFNNDAEGYAVENANTLKTLLAKD